MPSRGVLAKRDFALLDQRQQEIVHNLTASHFTGLYDLTGRRPVRNPILMAGVCRFNGPLVHGQRGGGTQAQTMVGPSPAQLNIALT